MFLFKLAVAHRNPAFEAMPFHLHRPMDVTEEVRARAQQMCKEVTDPWHQGYALLDYIEAVSLATHNGSPIFDRDPFIVYPPSIQHVHL